MSSIEDVRTTIEYISRSINRMAVAVNAHLMDEKIGRFLLYEAALISAASQELRSIGEKLYSPNGNIEKLAEKMRETQRTMDESRKNMEGRGDEHP